jgi:hypothetical protein
MIDHILTGFHITAFQAFSRILCNPHVRKVPASAPDQFNFHQEITEIIIRCFILNE